MVAPLPGTARQLAVLLHGVGGDAASMAPLAKAWGRALPGLATLALDGPESFDGGSDGRQWFSLRDITPEMRRRRATAALPGLLARIDAERTALGLDAAAVSLAGFSQGAIMALAAVGQGWRGRSVIALAGRMPLAPRHGALADMLRVLLAHGGADPVIPAAESVAAAKLLRAAGNSVDLRVFPGVGHAICAGMLQAGLEIMRSPPDC
jgi:phospholipase/carboxylesterase